MFKYRHALVLLAACLSGTCLAGTDKSLDLDSVRTQQAQIRAEVQAGEGRYVDMPVDKRHELLAKQDGLLKLIEGKQTDDQLTQSEQMEAFNTLEWIEATINNAEDERMICKREKPTGSNRMQSVCKTVAQRREERENSERMMNDRNAVCSEGRWCTGK